MIPSMASVVGTGTPPSAGGPELPVVCYTIGGCVFSELSFLSVTKYTYVQQVNCSITVSTTTEHWLFDSRTATTFRWALDADNWAEYSSDTGQWTFLAENYGTTLNPSCPNLSGPPLVQQSCGGYARSEFGQTGYRKLIEWTVTKNDCIPNVIA